MKSTEAHPCAQENVRHKINGKEKDRRRKTKAVVAFKFKAANTRMPGGQSTAPNCRFVASVTVHSLRSGGVMSAMRQLRQCVKRWCQCCPFKRGGVRKVARIIFECHPILSI